LTEGVAGLDSLHHERFLTRAMKIFNIRAVIKLELKRIWNSKPQLLLHLLAGPLILATIIGFVAYQSPQAIEVIAFVDKLPDASDVENERIRQLINVIDISETFSVVEVASLEEGLQRLDDGDTRALITFIEGESGLIEVDILIDITDPMIQLTIYKDLSVILLNYSTGVSLELITSEGIPAEDAFEILSPIDVRWRTNEHIPLTFSDLYASGFIILVVLAVSLLHSSTSITSERSQGTIERVFVSPYSKPEIILGKMIALGFFATIAAMICTTTLIIVHDITVGNIFLVFVTAALVGINGVALGLVISSVTYMERQSLLVAIVAFIGFVILMTWFWPFESMHTVAKYVSQGIPFTYAMDAIRQLNLLGGGFYDIWQDLAILTGSIIVLTATATLILRRKLK